MSDWAEWEVLDWLVFEAFEDLGDFLKGMSKHLDDTLYNRREHAEAYWGSRSGELLQELEEIERQFGRTFPTSLAYAVVVLNYSHCEFYLKKITDLLCKLRGLRVGLSSFRGNLTDRIELFFKAYSLPQLLASERTELRSLTLLRNCIAHNAGIVDGSRDEEALRRLIGRTDGLSLEGDQSLLISQAYCSSQASFIRDALRRLLHDNFGKQKQAVGAATR